MPTKDSPPPPGRRRRHLYAVPNVPNVPNMPNMPNMPDAPKTADAATPADRLASPIAIDADLLQWARSQVLDGPPSGGRRPAFRAPRHRRPRPTRTLRVRVDIADSRPPIWRRLDIDSDLTLHQVHAALQAAFGWLDGHLHQFVAVGPGRQREHFIGRDAGNDEGKRDTDGTDESSIRIGQLLTIPGESIFYEYDFGDGWRHRIVLEESLARAADATPVVCVAGRRRGPLEDSGGMGGYQRICGILADPTHPEHAETCAWVGVDTGNEFDPAEFSVDDVNGYLIEFDVPGAT